MRMKIEFICEQGLNPIFFTRLPPLYILRKPAAAEFAIALHGYIPSPYEGLARDEAPCLAQVAALNRHQSPTGRTAPPHRCVALAQTQRAQPWESPTTHYSAKTPASESSPGRLLEDASAKSIQLIGFSASVTEGRCCAVATTMPVRSDFEPSEVGCSEQWRPRRTLKVGIEKRCREVVTKMRASCVSVEEAARGSGRALLLGTIWVPSDKHY
ncbi:hypothetical protein BJV78DRAFT_1356331 [Lactifluus subvellereus]|nr:hypothetical protein BJV78DRAFT_1356331 [Lactifluus subvellereus]